MKIRVKKLNEYAILPRYSTDYAAGADLYSNMQEDITIKKGETKMIKTGIAIEIPSGYAAFVYARSGIAFKHGIAPSNKVGVIDSDYRGEIMVALHNHSNVDYIVEKGERIAQMVIAPYIKADFEICDMLNESERAEKGFGSTGKK